MSLIWCGEGFRICARAIIASEKSVNSLNGSGDGNARQCILHNPK